MRPGHFIVRRQDAGQRLAGWLASRMGIDGGTVKNLFARKAILVNGKVPASLNMPLDSGQKVTVSSPRQDSGKPSPKNPKVATPWPPRVVYMDQHIAVVDKPPGITTVHHASDKKEFSIRDQKFLPPTLQDILPGILSARAKKNISFVRAVHRLDKDTSGLILFALSPQALSSLSKQMRSGDINRRYLALTRGKPSPGLIESHLVKDRGDGRRGSKTDPAGEHALTRVSIKETLPGITLVECELETGRTHQVRIHLGEAGAPLCGEKIYDRPLHGRPLPDPSVMTRIALHSCSMAIIHPLDNRPMHWECDLPADMKAALEVARKQENPGSAPGV